MCGLGAPIGGLRSLVPRACLDTVSTEKVLWPLQVLNGMAVTLTGSAAERAAALARLRALPQVTHSAHCDMLVLPVS